MSLSDDREDQRHASHNHQAKPLIDIVLCHDHYERLEARNPCDECPSIPANMERCLKRAQQHEMAYKASVMASHQEHSLLLSTINEGVSRLTATVMKLDSTVLQSYLAVASVCIIGIFSILLWYGKTDASTHLTVTLVVLFPFYKSGIEFILRAVRGDRNDTNKNLSAVLATMFLGAVVLAQFAL